MSRSNPNANTPHPCTRWMEWDGSEGHLRWYDKEKEEKVNMKPDFTCILLDQCSVIKGWHEISKSGIVSNEVRDTRSDVMAVRSFKGGKIAEGIYQQIKEKVNAAGGHFTATLYVAFKPGPKEPLALGAIQIKGAALGAWMDFSKANRKKMYEQAIRIKGFVEGKKGTIKFRTPVFTIQALTEETNKEATFIDVELQAYLKDYFSRNTKVQVEKVAEQQHPSESNQDAPPDDGGEPDPDDLNGQDPDAGSDVPF